MNNKAKDWITELPPIQSSGFINRPPLNRPIPPSYRRFILYEAVVYDVGKPNSGDRIIVPAGFITDFASVPRIFWSLYPPMGKYAGATIIHDYLYITQERTRKETDLIFLEAMKVLNVPFFRRQIIYRAVRLGGWLPWRKRKRKLSKREI